jgi:hypothetical protein
MSEKEKEIVEISVPSKEQVAEIVDFIESELRPPSKLRWLFIFFLLGVAGGVGLGVFIAWLR